VYPGSNYMPGELGPLSNTVGLGPDSDSFRNMDNLSLLQINPLARAGAGGAAGYADAVCSVCSRML